MSATPAAPPSPRAGPASGPAGARSLGASFSIVHRLIGLAVAVGLLSLALNGALIFRAIDPLGEDLTEALHRQIATARLTLQRAPADQRQALAEELQALGLHLRRAPPPVPQSPGEPLMARLQALLGPEVRLTRQAAPDASADATTHLQASFQVNGEDWQLLLPTHTPPPGGPLLPLLAALAAVGLAAALTLVLGIRLITRPIARIADAMAERAGALRPLEAPPAAGRELQPLISGFNRLVAALMQAQASRRQLLAGLSHDLRTPLARLRLRVDVECPAAVAERMAPDFDAVERFVGQFLGFARGGAEISLGQPRPLAAQLHALATQYAAQGVQLQIEDSAAAERTGYPDLAIQRLLGNLVDNALAHGRPPVRIVAEGDADECRLWVRDAGPGLPPAGLSEALQPFVRLGPGNGLGGHAGLGLAIVAQLSAQLGGRVTQQPFDGQGHALGVALPRQRS
ncbi:HAMP domain-containing histidine kinase [Ideonella azotifigens]|uniref:histidine kinase n=2 Tax=Ideonella azotifigens TaxID=513160 RepID=A0ABN1KMB0_9BURK|nr:HAMP domain-containing sensor histidine kinase [Ideonella azotifigens]MCD2343430.1 HAMP domain-containing histidine kinase [Ideonella azotifigens]